MKFVLLFLMFGTAAPALAAVPAGHGYHAIELAHAVEYLQEYLRARWEVLRHGQFKDPALGFLMALEKAARGDNRRRGRRDE